MEIAYYPGCTLKTGARNFESSALAVLQQLGIEARELPEWYCCGVCFSQTDDNLMQQIAAIRTLIKAKETGQPRLLTLCTMCYNTLKRAILFIREDPDRIETMQKFMDRETTRFEGHEIEVVDILSLLQEVGAEQIQSCITPLESPLKVAAYYGCMLLRPKEIAIDSPEDPSIMENLLRAAGCEPVYFPFRTECCGSYQIVNEAAIVKDRTRKIITNAVRNGAELMVLLCPLCQYNLEQVQLEIVQEDRSFKTLPVLYFTQLLALRMGITPDIHDFSLHYIDPRPILSQKGLL